MKVKTIGMCLCLFLAGVIGSLAQEPDIDLSETIHNYGPVAVGDSLDWVLTIFNVGNDTLFVDSAGVDVPQFQIESPAFPDTVLPTPPKDSISVTLWFFPSDTGVVTGSLFVFSDDPDEETLTVVLSGTGILQDIALSDSTHDYGDIRVGDSLNWQLTIHNIGTDTLTVDSVLVDPALFQIASPSFPDTVPPVDSTFITVWFLPSDTGAVSGSLLVFSDDPDEETLTVVLSGTGILQDIAPSDTSHDYGDVAVGDSLDWVLTLYNKGTADLIVDSILSAPTEFGVTAPLLPDTLVPEDSILVTITFFPSDTGAAAGTVMVYSDDPDEETLAVFLLGNGVIPEVAVSDTSHDYGDVPVGDSLDWELTIYNWGTGALTVDSVLLEPSQFEIICTSFPQTIPPADSIGVNIRFKPTDWGAVVGSLLVFNTDPDEETLTIHLAGNGLAPDIVLPLSAHDFGDVVVGDSADWITEIHNVGNADLMIDSVLAVPPDFIVIAPLFPDSIAPSDTLAMTITFAPSDTGAVAGSLLVFSTDPDQGILTIALTGNGLAPHIAVSDTGHDFGDVFVGDSLEWDLWLFNVGTADLILDSLLTTPVQFELSAPSLPDTLSVGDSLAVTITFLPTDTGVVSGTLFVYSSDPYQGVLSLTLTGRGVVSEITLFPEALAATVWEGGIISLPLTVINEGTALLLFAMSDTVSWLSEDPDSGGVDPSDTVIVDVIFDASSLTSGDYYGTIFVTSNDPDEPELTVPVHLVVREAQVIVTIPDAWSLPGDTVTLTLDIDNETERDDPILGFESHISYVDTFLTVLDVLPTLRVEGLFDWNIPEPGRLIIIFVASELDAIESGTGPVAEITFEVNPGIPVGDSTTLHFRKVKLSDATGDSIPKRAIDGRLFLGTGIKGDVNMDGEVDILDVVWMVNYILERVEFTPFQFWAADCNEDAEVNIIDVVGVINVILEIGTCPPSPVPAKTVLSPARLWSPKEDAEITYPDIEIPVFIDSEMDMTGIQLVLSYDPTALTPQAPQLMGRASHMKLDYETTYGRLAILVYNPDGTSIPAGTGLILTASFNIQDSQPTTQKPMIEISHALLAGEGCHEIPVDICPIDLKGNLQPETWALEQNYPNPFNPTTTISYSIPTTALSPLVTLKIYNIVGQEVRTLIHERQVPGRHRATWDGTDEHGKKVSSGVYLYSLSASGTSRDAQGEFRDTKRMVLVK